MVNNILLAEENKIADIARALDSGLRRNIIAQLGKKDMTIKELSETLTIPQSTCTVNVQILEKAGLVATVQQVTPKGAYKLCSLACHEVVLPIYLPESRIKKNIRKTEMPIGLYTDTKPSAPCGLASTESVIGYFDMPDSFLNPHRASASLIWFSKGYLEYRFPRNYHDPSEVKSLTFSAEVCSEYPKSNQDWPSDISVWINGIEIGTWTCPGDMGGIRGRLTPEWWPIDDSQFGFLKTWRITPEGSFIDGEKTGTTSTSDVLAGNPDSIVVRIGIKDNAEFQGGMNLFGRGFGNYDQDLLLLTELYEYHDE